MVAIILFRAETVGLEVASVNRSPSFGWATLIKKSTRSPNAKPKEEAERLRKTRRTIVDRTQFVHSSTRASVAGAHTNTHKCLVWF